MAKAAKAPKGAKPTPAPLPLLPATGSPTCPYCKALTRMPCTDKNYAICGMFATFCASRLDVPHKPDCGTACDCAACEKAWRIKTHNELRPTTAELVAEADDWRIKVRQERAARKARKKAAKEEARKKNPAKWRLREAKIRPPGSRAAKKAKKRAERKARHAQAKPAARDWQGWVGAANPPAKPKPAAVLVPGREPTNAELDELIRMHTYCRPHKSLTEHEFIRRFVMPIHEAMRWHGVDTYGNLWGITPHKDERQPVRTMFSAHTDDVSNCSGRRNVATEAGMLQLAPGEDARCLGADNAAGVWMLMELARAHVPGLYVWHRDEEHGRCGSRHFAIANGAHPRFMDLHHAVAFDRRRFHSIISHQCGRRCCSDEFAKALAAALKLGHKPDDTGSYTDTASYMDLVSECTNVSVGFINEHGSDERLDLHYLCALRDAAIAADWDALPAKRDPSVIQPTRWSRTYTPQPDVPAVSAAPKPLKALPKPQGKPSTQSEAMRRAFPAANGNGAASAPREAPQLDDGEAWIKAVRTLEELCEEFPEAVADVLEQMGYDAKTLHSEILEAMTGGLTRQ